MAADPPDPAPPPPAGDPPRPPLPPVKCAELVLPPAPVPFVAEFSGADPPPCAVTTVPVVPADPNVVLPPFTGFPDATM